MTKSETGKANFPPRQITIPVPDREQVKRWVTGSIAVVIVIYVAYLVRGIWVPLGLAFILATVLDPVVDRMEARGFSRTMGAFVIFSSFLIVVVGGLSLLVPRMTHQVDQIQIYLARYFPDSSPAGLQKEFAHMHLPSVLAGAATEAIQGIQGGYHKSASSLTDYGMSVLSNLVWVAIIPIVTFYALRDFHLILGKALLLIPRSRRETVQTYVEEVTAIFARYLRGLMIVSALNGVATCILMACLRVPGALVLGVIAGLLYSVPYIGAILTIVLTAGVSFVAGGPNLMFLAVGTSMVLHQLVFDQMITPRVLGAHVGLHPILSIVALLAGNLLLGIIGMILAVPVAACIQIGVIALVPKLAQDIDFTSPVGEDDGLEHAAKPHPDPDPHTGSGPTHEMHQTVHDAINRVEAKLDEESARDGA